MKTTNATFISEIPDSEWVENRKNYIGGSEAAAALGKPSYKTPYQLWLIKTGRKQPVESTEIMELGHLLEPMVAEKFSHMTGLKLRKIIKPYQHPQHSFLRGNIDRQIVTSDKHGGPGVLEIKTTTSYRLKNEAGAYPIEWDYQIQHYLMLTGYEYAYLAIFERDTGIFHEPVFIQRDEKLIQENTERLIQWWENHVVKDVAPQPINNEDLMILYPDAKDGSAVEATPNTYSYYEELKKIRGRINDLEYQKEVLEVMLKQEIGDCERLVVAGRDLITWKNQTTTRIDTKKLKQRYPALCRKFSNTNTTRRFVVK